MKHVVALGVVLLSTAAYAEPIGTPLTFQVSHSGIFGETQNFVHTYGGSNTVFDSFGLSYMVVSSANAPGWDNSIRLDFSEFFYGDFSGETGTMSITGFTQPVLFASFLDANFDPIPAAGFTATSIGGSWAVDDVLVAGEPVIYVGWNKVPAPGAAALFGLAGLCGVRRRR